MKSLDTMTIWTIILGLAVGSFALRFLFIGFVGNRPMPTWLLRHLRYTAVAILPALVAPLVVWPTSNDGQPELSRIAAAVMVLLVGYKTNSVLAAMLSGAVTLYSGLYLFG